MSFKINIPLSFNTEKEELIDIEVQINQNMNYRKRSVYYWSQLYNETLKDGQDYFKLKKCVVISILGFNLIYESEKYHTVFKIKEAEENFELLDDLEIHYLEIKKFIEDREYKIELEKWVAVMKTAGEEGKEDLIERLKKESWVVKYGNKKIRSA